MAQTDKSRIYQEGLHHGYCVASWNDLPEIGSSVDKAIDWFGIDTIETVSDAADYFMMVCSIAEDYSRQYSPFEFTAKELNELQESKDYDVWQVFEDGIQDGFLKNWKERKSYYKD